MGYYGGLGARKITTVNPTATLPQNQPNCLTQASTGLIDCGNWAVSGSWAVPADGDLGHLLRQGRAHRHGRREPHRVHRAQRCEHVGPGVPDFGHDLAGLQQLRRQQPVHRLAGHQPGPRLQGELQPSVQHARASTAARTGCSTAEYPMVRWLEANGYDVSYITGVDTDRAASLLLDHRSLPVGRPRRVLVGPAARERRSRAQRRRQPGVLQRQRSVLEDALGKQHRRFGHRRTARWSRTRKRTPTRRSIPTREWTGTWRDPRFSPPADGGRPENGADRHGLHRELGHRGHRRPGRGRQDAPVARHDGRRPPGTGRRATLPNGTLGYEWDSDLDNGSRPAGLIRLSDTTVSGVDKLQDYGSTYAADTANHALTMYKHIERRARLRRRHHPVVVGPRCDSRSRRHAGRPAHAAGDGEPVRGHERAAGEPAARTRPRRARRPTTPRRRSTITTPAAGANVPQNSVDDQRHRQRCGRRGRGHRGVDRRRHAPGIRPSGRAHLDVHLGAPPTTGPVTVRVRGVDDSGNLPGHADHGHFTVGGAACPCSLWPAVTPSGGVGRGSELGRARHALPLERGRQHHRAALLQALAEHRHARRQPVDCRWHAARAGDLHG